MGTTVFDMYKRVEALDVNEITSEAIHQSARGYVEKQRMQMYEGVNSDGKERPPYSPYTVAIKIRKGQRYDVVTLKDTGDFYKSLFIDVREDTFVISAHDPKTLKIVDRYGDIVFGLVAPWKQLFITEDLYPTLLRLIEEATGLKAA